MVEALASSPLFPLLLPVPSPHPFPAYSLDDKIPVLISQLWSPLSVPKPVEISETQGTSVQQDSFLLLCVCYIEGEGNNSQTCPGVVVFLHMSLP